MSKIRPPELDDRLSRGDGPFVLDVRPRESYQQYHIDGSHNVPVYGDLRRGDDDALRRRLDEIPDDEPVVTVCKAGVVARKATSVLEDEGYDATTLAGGIRGWKGYENETIGYRLKSLLWRVM
ncbi:rhodanese-like domain-containing protein [Natribaculum luteum]|uniref:Rhodanese-like domain-containing protein n=1 Tax=Natribaculum luteum TaxID=1586232 RepID=A0ABD5P452_9EURY|nr:rhodanese-like domain-containing protein [Natribaculum luteum]